MEDPASSTLLKTIAGSHLYNLANENSDLDYYIVLNKSAGKHKKWIKQNVVNGIDTITANFSTFVFYSSQSSHQSLDAMFSPIAEVDHIADYRQNYFVNLVTMREKYMRTIKSFALGAEPKKIRHAFRLSRNLAEALTTGRFNPRLTDEQAQEITYWAGRENYLEYLKKIMPLEAEWLN